MSWVAAARIREGSEAKEPFPRRSPNVRAAVKHHAGVLALLLGPPLDRRVLGILQLAIIVRHLDALFGVADGLLRCRRRGCRFAGVGGSEERQQRCNGR